jgi:hypothetical protein
MEKRDDPCRRAIKVMRALNPKKGDKKNGKAK